MSVHQIDIDILCDIPSWVQDHHDLEFQDTKYRIYVDDDLLTERDWDLGNNLYVKERMWIHSDKDQEHIFRLVPVIKSKTQAKFTLRNFMIDEKEHTQYPGDLDIKFTT